LLGVAPQSLSSVAIAAASAVPARPAAPRPPVPGAYWADRPRATATAPFEPVRNAATMLGAATRFPQIGRAASAAESDPPDASPAPEPAPPPVAAAPVVAQSEAPLPAAESMPAHPNPMHAKTQMGVAIPGIAPLRASLLGAGAPPSADAWQQPPTASQPVVPPAATATGSIRFQVPRGALALLGSGVVLLAAALLFALLWTGGKSVSATLASDPSGKERIDLVCSDCPDGTLLQLDGSKTEVRDRKAYIVPKGPLPLGKNTLALELQRPGAGVEQMEVNLPPIEYRIRPDTSTLIGDQPRLRLDIEALPGTLVELGGEQVTLDPSGRGVREVDVSGQLLGQSSEISTFEQTVPYAITSPNKQYKGELRVKIGVTPLLLEAPGTDSVTDLERFMLAGRTTSGAEVFVAGSPLPVDQAGRFAQMMSIDSEGETNVRVRATQPGLAPRFASFRLERVKSLEAAATVRRQGALALADVVKDISGSVGKTVVVRGRVEDVLVEGQRSIVILAADCSGRDCLARLSYGGLRKLERGARVTTIGKVVGAAASQNVPEIEVSLLL
jgi:hypothetical protein